jgi:hypothetical protein
MKQDNDFYVGVDVSKAKHAMLRVAAMEKVPYFGEIEATPAAVERFVRKLEKKCSRLQVFLEFNFLDASQRRLRPTSAQALRETRFPPLQQRPAADSWAAQGLDEKRYHFIM